MAAAFQHHAAEPAVTNQPKAFPHLARTTAVVVAIVLGIAAFARNQSIVSDLQAPGIDIQYRELAAAQTIVDQGYGPDSNYPGEHVWYNPMASWLVVALARVTGAPLPLVVARAGPYVNAVAPIALFGCVAFLFDVFSALGAVAAFTFVVGTRLPFYYSATYSPWFAPENVGQAFLYASLPIMWCASVRTTEKRWAMAGGVLLGLAFLTHTAPAIVGGLMWMGVAALDWRRSGSRAAIAGGVAMVLAVAFAVALPFEWHILGYYRLRIVNPFPSQSPSELLDLNELPTLLSMLATGPTALGAGALIWRAVARRDRAMTIVLVWSAVVGGLLSANVLRLLLRRAGIEIPAVVPAFHFFFYVKTIIAVGVGLGLRDVAHALTATAFRRRTPLRDAAAGLLAVALTLALVGGSYGQYRERVDFTEIRDEAVLINKRLPVDLIAWIRERSNPADVFLSEDDVSLYVVAPAGRKVVATNRFFSNPYVDWVSRDRDRREMYRLLEQRDVARFQALARQREVRYVVASQERNDAWLKASGLRPSDIPALDVAFLATAPGLSIAYRDDRFTVLALAR